MLRMQIIEYPEYFDNNAISFPMINTWHNFCKMFLLCFSIIQDNFVTPNINLFLDIGN